MRRRRRKFIANHSVVNKTFPPSSELTPNRLDDLRKRQVKKASKQEWYELLRFFYKRKCIYCRVRLGKTRDHVIPISEKVLPIRGNIVPSCGKCNRVKGDRTITYLATKQKLKINEAQLLREIHIVSNVDLNELWLEQCDDPTAYMDI